MIESTAALARSITWNSSKQTYYTARTMVDKELMDDAYRAYAYLRWVDDTIDIISQSDEERIAFTKRQRDLLDRLYRKDIPDDLTPEEEMVACLIRHDGEENSKLRSFICNMFDIIEFDAYRRGQLISQEELIWYSDSLSKSIIDGLQYFIGHGHPYSKADDRYLAAIAAHIIHMLRDMLDDVQDGYFNIPREYLEAHNLTPLEFNNPSFLAWVKDRVELARAYFRRGQKYFDQVDILRNKITGYWYCIRFEVVLDTIEREGYVLREEYNEKNKISTMLKFAWKCLSLTIHHISQRGFRDI
jgi:phytoene/squalene synthetase